MLRGVELFLLGLFKKVVVADNLALLADHVFTSPQDYSGAAVLAGTWAFWAQIYCDFSGYSTMAQGLASMLGFWFPKNFDYPQLRHNPLQYRRTWHITLGNWITDYVYRPLGGSRVGDVRFAFNLVFNGCCSASGTAHRGTSCCGAPTYCVILAIYSSHTRKAGRCGLPGKLFWDGC